MARRLRILVFPRDKNPYQDLLYGEIRRQGAQVRFIGRVTPFHTVNLLLLPLEVVIRRLAGAQFVHIHWVFSFTFPGSARFPVIRRAAQKWFVIWLRACHIAGLYVIWTLHNVLPHDPVFADDVAARRDLVSASDLVLAHSKQALGDLAAIGARPGKSAVIQHGPLGPYGVTGMLRVPGSGAGPRRFLLLGRIKSYKGVDDLLTAFQMLPEDAPVHLTVAGECDEEELRARLADYVASDNGRLVVRAERLADDEVTRLMAASDLVVLPFKRVTTSGSAILALSHGRPLIVPRLPATEDFPDSAVFRYEGGVQGLAAAMLQAADMESTALSAMSDAALRYAHRLTWPEIAERTLAEMTALVAGPVSAVGVHG
jgi:glycosyltransferase involved in cell wall biosynthesis